jgi:hypothetical protein
MKYNIKIIVYSKPSPQKNYFLFGRIYLTHTWIKLYIVENRF